MTPPTGNEQPPAKRDSAPHPRSAQDAIQSQPNEGEKMREDLQRQMSERRADALRLSDAEPSGQWRPIESAPRDGTVFVACNLDHPSFGSWPMYRRVRHRVERDGGWSTEDLGGWVRICDVEPDYQEGHETGPDPTLSIAADDWNTSVRYGWMPLPAPPEGSE